MKKYVQFIKENSNKLTSFKSEEMLYNAVIDEDQEAIKKLVDSGVDINMKMYFNKYNNKITSLMYCCGEGKTDFVKFLLTIPGIDINIKSESGNNNALSFAKNIEIFKILLNRPEIRVNDIPVIYYSNLGELRLLLKRPDIDVNFVGKLGTTLARVISLNDLEKVKLLLKHPDIDVNKTNKDNDSNPLIIAALNNNIEAIKLLLQHPDIDVNLKNLKDDNFPTILFYYNKHDLYNKGSEKIKLFLAHPDIDVLRKNSEDKYFIDLIDDKDFLIDKELQIKILKNGRIDILRFLDQYDLAYPGILDNPDAFIKSADWGLI